VRIRVGASRGGRQHHRIVDHESDLLEGLPDRGAARVLDLVIARTAVARLDLAAREDPGVGERPAIGPTHQQHLEARRGGAQQHGGAGDGEGRL